LEGTEVVCLILQVNWLEFPHSYMYPY
jgi:hypothetical protein